MLVIMAILTYFVLLARWIGASPRGCGADCSGSTKICAGVLVYLPASTWRKSAAGTRGDGSNSASGVYDFLGSASGVGCSLKASSARVGLCAGA